MAQTDASIFPIKFVKRNRIPKKLTPTNHGRSHPMAKRGQAPPIIFKIELPYQKIKNFLNQTCLAIVSALLFLKSEIEKSGLGHSCTA